MDNLKIEYPNKCHVRDVKVSEKHPKIREKEEGGEEGCEKVREKVENDEEEDDDEDDDEEEEDDDIIIPEKDCYKTEERIKEENGGVGRVDGGSGCSSSELDFGKKKKRKTEQEKLIASLNQTELTHVDGAFKRSTTIRYNNLNEDKLLDNLFDSRSGKPKRSSGKKMMIVCCEETNENNANNGDTMESKKKRKTSCCGDNNDGNGNGNDDSIANVGGNSRGGSLPEIRGETCEKSVSDVKKMSGEVKKKRKTEKEKLIENLSAIERIHVDGAFKRNVFKNNISPFYATNEVAIEHYILE